MLYGLGYKHVDELSSLVLGRMRCPFSLSRDRVACHDVDSTCTEVVKRVVQATLWGSDCYADYVVHIVKVRITVKVKYYTGGKLRTPNIEDYRTNEGHGRCRSQHWLHCRYRRHRRGRFTTSHCQKVVNTEKERNYYYQISPLVGMHEICTKSFYHLSCSSELSSLRNNPYPWTDSTEAGSALSDQSNADERRCDVQL